MGARSGDVTPSRLGLAGPDDFNFIGQVLNDISQRASGATVSGRVAVLNTNDLGFALQVPSGARAAPGSSGDLP